MWGGIKARTHYGDHFRHWSATKGLDELRRILYQEPRPWFIAFSLHQRQHLLQDHHCARLMAWCTTVVQLREGREQKQEAYRHAQETFAMLTHSHKAGKEALFEYMRLCAAGKDLTTAYEWHKFWLDTKSREEDGATRGAGLLQQYAWLLRIALESPSDESAEDMAVAVKEGYSDRCCTPTEHTRTGEKVLAHFEPTSAGEEAALHGLFCAFRALERRLRFPNGKQEDRKATDDSEGLRAFMAALPVSDEEAQRWVDSGWPSSSHCHNFPQLEGGAKAPAPTPTRPSLRDSLLSDHLVKKLEHAAFTQRDVAAVITILKWYQECITMEREKKDSGARRLHQRKLDGELLDVWRQFADGTAHRFRASVVEAGGLTPELYHYVISALAHTQPTAALRTLQRIREANLRVLDITRAVALVGAQGSFPDQLQLFTEQLAEIAARQKLDDDFDISKRVEVYWKYQYTDFFHYMNAMDKEAFYGFLMEGLQVSGDEEAGPQAVQKLLLASHSCGPTATEEDLVILDDALRSSAARYFRRRLGPAEVDTAMNIITKHMPKLDISLVGSIPHFSDYALPDGDDVMTDVATLADKLRQYDTVYVLDTSFVETSEGFLHLGRGSSSGGETAPARSLVLLPFVTLAQLGQSVANANAFVSFDPALMEAVKEEPFLASQRLRSLFAFLNHKRGAGPRLTPSLASPPGGAVDVRVLHFTECLLAHSLPRETVVETLHLSPGTSDNDHLLLLLALISSTVKPNARVVLCSDDPVMLAKLSTPQPDGAGVMPSFPTSSLFRAPVGVLRTQAPEAVVDVGSGLIDDNPSFDFSEDGFVPKMDVSCALKCAHSPASAAAGPLGEGSASPAPAATATKEALTGDSSAADAPDEAAARSPWLSLLEGDGDEEEVGTTSAAGSLSSVDAATPAAATALEPSVPTSHAEEDALAQREEELMNLYANPYDVVPVGVRMQEASAIGSVFTQFDVLEPEEAEQRRQEREARRSRLQQSGAGGAGGKRRRSHLEKEMLDNRGASFKERRQLARQMSNMSGGRVPFNFRYRVVEANVRDPRNAHLRRSLEDGVRKTREVFKRRSR